MSHKTQNDVWRGRIRSLSHWYFYIRVSVFLQITYSCDNLIKRLYTDWQTRLITAVGRDFFYSSPLCQKWHCAAACAKGASCLPQGGKAAGIWRLLTVPRCRMSGDLPALPLGPSRCVAEAQGNSYPHSVERRLNRLCTHVSSTKRRTKFTT